MTLYDTSTIKSVHEQMEEPEEELKDLADKLDLQASEYQTLIYDLGLHEVIEIMAEDSEAQIVLSSITEDRQRYNRGTVIGYKVMEFSDEV